MSSVLLMLTALALGIVFIGSASHAHAAGAILFSDNFQSDPVGQPPAGWTVTGGNWTVGVDVTNVLKQTDTNSGPVKSIFAGSSGWTDYGVRAQVKPGSTGWNLGYTLNARYTDDNNTYSLALKNGNTFYFGKRVAGTWTTFTSGTYNYNTSTWYTMEIDAVGGSISAYVNGTLLGSKADSSFSSGRIGFLTHYAGEFNNVVVTQMTAPPPSPSPSPSPSASPSPSPSASPSPSPSASPSASPTPSPSPTPQPGNGTITGNIADATSAAGIAGAQVSTQPASSTTVSDGAGNYTLSSVASGTYDVMVSAPGYNNNFIGSVAVSGSATVTASQSLVAIPGQTATDLFSRPDQSGLGTASDGHTWSDDRSTYPNGTVNISGRQLFVQTATAQTDYDQWMGNPYQDEEVSADFLMVQGGARVLARVQNANTWVELAVNPTTAWPSNLALWTQQPNNVWNQIAVSNVPLQKGVWYHSKFDVIGTGVYAKVWPVGGVEPGWQVTANQSLVAGPGVGGLRTAVANTYFTSFTETAITRVAGQVTDAATTQPIAGATMTLSTGATVTTDSGGNYVFSGLSAGSYTVAVSASGYAGRSQSVTATTGTTTTANFAL